MDCLCVVIVAAGSGLRFSSSPPKQFLFLYNIISRFLSITRIQKIVCVIPEKFLKDYQSDDRVIFVYGGDKRQKSVKNGLDAVKSFGPSHVLIHDAARPYCSEKLIEEIIDTLEQGALSAIPAIQPVDSVRICGESVQRDAVSLIQTPQGFEFETIYNLHEKHDGLDVSDDASLFDLEGLRLSFIPGEMFNKKITYKNDISGGSMRIGLGFDSHAFSKDPNRKLKLCGVEIPDISGLDGVSDADVAVHSIIDAILGAMGRGSIGDHFPENAELSKNADSMHFLKAIVIMMYNGLYVINNIDITIVCDAPRISVYREMMIENIAKCLMIDEAIINIKGKTTEGTNITGIAAFTNILLTSK